MKGAWGVMTTGNQFAAADPVLVRLHQWATDRGLTRAAVAKRLGVSRAAVAGWFLALEASRKGEAAPSSGRTFHYTDQSSHVQAAVAEVLGEPVDRLRAESLGSRADRSAAGVLEAAGEMLDVGRLVLGEINAGRTPQPQSLAHRAAEVVERVTGTLTLIMPEPRGSDRAQPYQYQLVVFYAEPDGPDSGPEDENGLMEAITEGLRVAALPAYWEHGVKTPAVDLMQPGGPRWKRLGSLVIPHVAMSHASSVGLLVRPSPRSRSQRNLRHAVIVTPPYGGSDPVGGYLSAALGTGHIRAVDVVRAFDDALVLRSHDDRRALINRATLLDACYSVQKALYLLQAGAVPGAWIMSMEIELPYVFEPLADDLVRFEGPLMLVRLGPQWQRMVAWRLAAAKLNMDGRKDGAELPWSGDQVDFGTPPSPRDLETLRRQLDAARETGDQLSAWDELMVDIGRQRRRRVEQGQATGPTFDLVLDPLPEDGGAIRFDHGHWEPVSGAGRFEGMVMFPDAVEALMDAWVQAAVDLLDELARLAGHPDASALTDDLSDGPVRQVIEHRPATGTP
jgi:hypothetical protein